MGTETGIDNKTYISYVDLKFHLFITLKPISGLLLSILVKMEHLTNSSLICKIVEGTVSKILTSNWMLTKSRCKTSNGQSKFN